MKFSKPILASVNKNNEVIQMIVNNDIGLVLMGRDSAYKNEMKTFLSAYIDELLKWHSGKITPGMPLLAQQLVFAEW